MMVPRRERNRGAVMPSTRTGDRLDGTASVPSCPMSLRPQHLTVSRTVITQVKPYPAEMSLTPFGKPNDADRCEP